ncbi:hypothetical protein SPRG_11414 [Saprolegnia parasitica CBS 223.65]|uniref:Amino acid transporter n=1 Tax=Saprolegnia parasitica (strain CBS 223.65) TaxID=695850 RepID=A0A067CAB1_SAPPC|nr:hypothetical protein SPRG_11414 [Saprolegnia parasitica CBS 223.65]KDO23491.1 hypothetical protein SPRG_11414 [Saprolegnia parasitica CBS 223.65]|eukprot:XP_012205805.1 hypothetical protein SPRG_11414 [Saprolegnia parasitica CBS 223.65]
MEHGVKSPSHDGTVEMDYANDIGHDVRAQQGSHNARTNDETRSRYLHWFLGAPGTLLGTLIALCVVFGVVGAAGDNTNFGVVYHDHAKYTYAIGCLFLRALTCIVVPKIVLDVALSCADVVRARRMFQFRRRIVGLALLTTLLASAQGLAWGLLLGHKFRGTTYTFRPAALGLLCPRLESDNTTTTTLTGVVVVENGTLACTTHDKLASFGMADDVFKLRNTIKRWTTYASVGDEIQSMVRRLVPRNLTLALLHGDVAGAVVFAIVLGIALGVYDGDDGDDDAGSDTRIVKVLRELNAIFEIMMSYVVTTTPVALIPLIVGPLLSGTHGYEDFARLGYFVLAYLAAIATHGLVVLPTVLVLASYTHPLRWFQHVRQALLYGLACSSSRQSLPLTMRALDKHVGTPEAARFGVVVGTTLNRNGASMYITLSLVWLFYNAGLDDRLTPVKTCLILLCGGLGSLAAAPVRSGGIAIVVSFWAMLSGIPTPYAYSLLLVAECIMDPLATMINMAGNLVVAHIVGNGNTDLLSRQGRTSA